MRITTLHSTTVLYDSEPHLTLGKIVLGIGLVNAPLAVAGFVLLTRPRPSDTSRRVLGGRVPGEPVSHHRVFRSAAHDTSKTAHGHWITVPVSDRFELLPAADGGDFRGVHSGPAANEDAPAGEILLTSMDRDGTRIGFDLELTRTMSEAVSVPVIASGGVGNLEHLADGVLLGKADAVLAASIFHFGEYTILQAKQAMAAHGIEVRL